MKKTILKRAAAMLLVLALSLGLVSVGAAYIEDDWTAEAPAAEAASPARKTSARLAEAECDHVADAEWHSDGETHWHLCTLCGAKVDEAAHIEDGGTYSSAEGHWHKCSVCEAQVRFGEHVAPEDWTYSASGHSKTCNCGWPMASESHDWDVEHGEVLQEATCTEGAVILCHCTTEGCTQTWMMSTAAPGHITAGNYSHDENYHWIVCETCGQAAETPAPHSWSDWTETPAGCVEDGALTRTCTVCGAEESTPIPAVGHHQWGEWTVTPATCTEDGSEVRTCSVCDEVETVILPSHGHVWTGWEETSAPTCTEDGEEYRECVNCDATETKAVESEGHVWGGWTETTVPTCTEDGEERRDCVNCDAFETQVIPASGHDWTEGWYTDGIAHWHECLNDNCPITDNAEKDGYALHNTEGHVAHVDATCSGTGVQGGDYCTVCNHGKAAAEIILSKNDNHSWDAGVVTTPAKPWNAGVKTFTCTVCSATRTETIPAIIPGSGGGSGSGSDNGGGMGGGGGAGGGGGGGGGAAPAPAAPSGGETADPDEFIDLGDEDVPLTQLPLPFEDVADNAWYRESVAYAYYNDLMVGVSGTSFAPGLKVDRASIVTVLYRLEKTPDAGNLENIFSDVASGQWYSDAVVWAADAGLVKGYDDGTFGGSDVCTREQLVVFLYRFAVRHNLVKGEKADLSVYTDAASVSAYAVEAMSWAVAKELVQGWDNQLMPTQQITREQLAVILQRFCENIADLSKVA